MDTSAASACRRLGRTPWRYLRGLEDGVCGFFADHVDRARDEKAGDAWKDGSVDDADTARSVHAEIARKNAAGLSRANRASAACVVPPGVLANELPQWPVVLQVCSRRFFTTNQSAALQPFRHSPNAANALDDCREIAAVLIGSFLEVAKIDLRRIAWIA